MTRCDPIAHEGPWRHCPSQRLLGILARTNIAHTFDRKTWPMAPEAPEPRARAVAGAARVFWRSNVHVRKKGFQDVHWLTEGRYTYKFIYLMPFVIPPTLPIVVWLGVLFFRVY
jgi:hypothetical protein